jgi:hypothetical protein
MTDSVVELSVGGAKSDGCVRGFISDHDQLITASIA